MSIRVQSFRFRITARHTYKFSDVLAFNIMSENLTLYSQYLFFVFFFIVNQIDVDHSACNFIVTVMFMHNILLTQYTACTHAWNLLFESFRYTYTKTPSQRVTSLLHVTRSGY